MRTFTNDDVAPLIEALTEFVGRENFDKSVASWRKTLANARQIERVQAEQSAFYWWPPFSFPLLLNAVFSEAAGLLPVLEFLNRHGCLSVDREPRIFPGAVP